MRKTNNKPKALHGVVSAADVMNAEYSTTNLGPYEKHVGKPAHNFDMALHGQPGVGKTYWLLKLANWYANNVGKTLFVSTEEFGARTLADKIGETKATSPNLHFASTLSDANIDEYALVILDSVNDAGLSLDNYKKLRQNHPNTAMILILQKNKKGEFKGGKDWEHEVEIFGELRFNDEKKRVLDITKNRYGIMGEKNI